eukprot:TRINITY_DN293_c0_g1_i6.p1 TRINITY_DN293_c0_g1~~TRINITY_DN293_c0_g1_i6.p1  ORF type:complete len:131 (-),score=11.92 TRINITY_DN293_c0_g1_i6:800-1141(-)
MDDLILFLVGEKNSSEAFSSFPAVPSMQQVIDDFMGFFYAIDWSEKWLWGLALLHLFLYAVTLRNWNNHNVQIALWILTSLLFWSPCLFCFNHEVFFRSFDLLCAIYQFLLQC